MYTIILCIDILSKERCKDCCQSFNFLLHLLLLFNQLWCSLIRRALPLFTCRIAESWESMIVPDPTGRVRVGRPTRIIYNICLQCGVVRDSLAGISDLKVVGDILSWGMLDLVSKWCLFVNTKSGASLQKFWFLLQLCVAMNDSIFMNEKLLLLRDTKTLAVTKTWGYSASLRWCVYCYCLISFFWEGNSEINHQHAWENCDCIKTSKMRSTWGRRRRVQWLLTITRSSVVGPFWW